MKKYLLIISLHILSGSGFTQNVSNPGEYMTFFSTEYLQIQQDMWDYTRSVSHGRNARTVEKKRAELIASTKNALNRAKNARDYNGDSRYRDSVVRYFYLIDVVLSEDYAKIVDMEAVAEQSYDAMEAYLLARELASDKLQEAGKMIDVEHRNFAEANNVTLIENESKLNQKIEIANLIYDHYNEVYLIFFKSYKQESYLIDAISRNDVSAIEQNRNALLEVTADGLSKLPEVKKYEDDPSMINSTLQLLAFYREEATKNVDVVIAYLQSVENFNSIKEAFEKKKQKDRTQADVDEFNNAVNDINASVTAYNTMNEEANKNRGELIDQWNDTAEKFTNRHVPKGK